MDDRTGQTASLSNINITNSSSDARYRISGNVTVTRAATTSSSLVTTLTYTDGDRRLPMNMTMAGFNSAGAVATTPANTTTATGVLNFAYTINVQGGTTITYSTAYLSSGATTMQYAIHIRDEQI